MKHNSPIYKNYWISIVPYFGKWDEDVQTWEILCIQNLLTGDYYPNRARFETYEEALGAGIYAVEQQIKLKR